MSNMEFYIVEKKVCFLTLPCSRRGTEDSFCVDAHFSSKTEIEHNARLGQQILNQFMAFYHHFNSDIVEETPCCLICYTAD